MGFAEANGSSIAEAVYTSPALPNLESGQTILNWVVGPGRAAGWATVRAFALCANGTGPQKVCVFDDGLGYQLHRELLAAIDPGGSDGEVAANMSVVFGCSTSAALPAQIGAITATTGSNVAGIVIFVLLTVSSAVPGCGWVGGWLAGWLGTCACAGLCCGESSLALHPHPAVQSHQKKSQKKKFEDVLCSECCARSLTGAGLNVVNTPPCIHLPSPKQTSCIRLRPGTLAFPVLAPQLNNHTNVQNLLRCWWYRGSELRRQNRRSLRPCRPGRCTPSSLVFVTRALIFTVFTVFPRRFCDVTIHDADVAPPKKKDKKEGTARVIFSAPAVLACSSVWLSAVVWPMLRSGILLYRIDHHGGFGPQTYSENGVTLSDAPSMNNHPVIVCIAVLVLLTEGLWATKTSPSMSMCV